MNVFCLGVSHHTASVRLRECLTLEGEHLNRALAVFACRQADFAPIAELAILSTCSRLEIYAAAPTQPGEYQDLDACFAPLLSYAREVFKIHDLQLEPYLYRFSGEQVVRHLCRVAASLDSMVLGDPQVLGQVSTAHRLALAQGSSRHVLSSLFRTAIHAGKRVRTETAIGRHPTHMSAVAIRLAERSLDLRASEVMVVGTGEIGQQSLEALADYGVRRLVIASRSPERARHLANTWPARPTALDQLPQALAQVDCVLSSTTSHQPVIERGMLEQALPARGGRPLVLVDLAVPRNIDPAIRELPGVSLYDLDDIQAFIETAKTRRQNEVPRAEEIVNEETAAFKRWLAVIPVVGELHRRAEAIRQHEVERALQRLTGVDPKVMEQIEFLSQSLVRKILHEPTARLRAEADSESLDTYVGLISSLFGLSEPGRLPPDGLLQSKGDLP